MRGVALQGSPSHYRVSSPEILQIENKLSLCMSAKLKVQCNDFWIAGCRFSGFPVDLQPL